MSKNGRISLRMGCHLDDLWYNTRMENDTTTTALTLFSILCDERSSAYGPLYIVAANSESEAEDMILAEVRGERGFKIDRDATNAIGTTEYGDGSRIVSVSTWDGEGSLRLVFRT